MVVSDKKCGFFKSIGRYNLGLVAEIAGPITGYPNLRVKRINRQKGQLLMWERGEFDVLLDKSEIQFLRVAGYNFPYLKGTNGVKYATYFDVIIDGKVNRIQMQSMTVAPDALHMKKPFDGGIPVVSGWIKNLAFPNDRDEHFSDMLCPAGYQPLIKEYVQAVKSPMTPCLNDLGIAPYLVPGVDYVMEGPAIFDKIEVAEEVVEDVQTPSTTPLEAKTEKEEVVELPKEESEPVNNKYAELVELKKLVDLGIITQEDYEIKKCQILGIEKEKKPSNKGGAALFVLSLVASGLALIMCLLCVFFGLFRCVWIDNGWKMTLFASLFNSNPTTGLCWYFFISYLVATALAATILAFVLKKKSPIFNLCLSILGLPVTIVCGILSMANYTRDFYWTAVHHEIEFRWPILVNGIFIFVAVLFFTMMTILAIIGVVSERKQKQ